MTEVVHHEDSGLQTVLIVVVAIALIFGVWLVASGRLGDAQPAQDSIIRGEVSMPAPAAAQSVR